MTKICLQVLTVFFVLNYFTVSAQPNHIKTATTAQCTDTAKYEKFKVFILKQMAHDHVPGISVAVLKNYRVIMVKGYGWADKKLKIPVSKTTLFQAASISKSLNGVGVLKLAQEHKIDLYTDINQYLYTWQFPYDSLSKGKKITLAHLLSHTAGITFHGFHGYKPGTVLPTTLEILKGEKPANSEPIHAFYEPGIKFEYSGAGVYLSQLVIQDVTRQPYADYMRTAVLNPLGMTGSTFDFPPIHSDPKKFASGYDINGNLIPGRYHIFPEQASAGLWTNPNELAKYIIETQLAYEGRSAKVLNQKFTKLRLTPYLNDHAALGVFISNFGGTLYFTHSGENPGFQSVYFGSLKGGNGIIVMTNSDNSEILDKVIADLAYLYNLEGLAPKRFKIPK